jgi:asparagine synthase (glutamine-hydrolysing)
MGVKPLYYSQSGAGLSFASELKAFRAGLRGATPSVDPSAVALFLDRGYVSGPETIYRGISRLAPASVARFDGQALRIETYWDLRAAAAKGMQNPFEEDDVAIEQAFASLLRDVVRSQRMADVPLGAFLSGGIDSSLVVAMMQLDATRSVRTFSIGVRDVDYDESSEARAVARHLGTEHNELIVDGSSARTVVPKLPTFYDEPFADSSQLPTFIVAQLARSQVTVSLSGDGGDELFGGYNRYVWLPRIAPWVHYAPEGMRRFASRLLDRASRDESPAMKEVGRVVARMAGARLVWNKLGKVAALANETTPQAMYRRLLTSASARELALSPIRDAAISKEPGVASTLPIDEFMDFRSWMMLEDQLGYLPDDILVKLDRASMAVALEARVPLLDNRIVDFAWRVPRRLRIRNGESKHLLKRTLSNYVPRALWDRPKSGFGVPVDDWLRHDLRDWASELLRPERVRRYGFLDPERVDALFRAHLQGRSGGARLWTVLMLQAWLETWMGA